MVKRTLEGLALAGALAAASPALAQSAATEGTERIEFRDTSDHLARARWSAPTKDLSPGYLRHAFNERALQVFASIGAPLQLQGNCPPGWKLQGAKPASATSNPAEAEVHRIGPDGKFQIVVHTPEDPGQTLETKVTCAASNAADAEKVELPLQVSSVAPDGLGREAAFRSSDSLSPAGLSADKSGALRVRAGLALDIENFARTASPNVKVGVAGKVINDIGGANVDLWVGSDYTHILHPAAITDERKVDVSTHFATFGAEIEANLATAPAALAVFADAGVGVGFTPEAKTGKTTHTESRTGPVFRGGIGVSVGTTRCKLRAALLQGTIGQGVNTTFAPSAELQCDFL